METEEKITEGASQRIYISIFYPFTGNEYENFVDLNTPIVSKEDFYEKFTGFLDLYLDMQDERILRGIGKIKPPD